MTTIKIGQLESHHLEPPWAGASAGNIKGELSASQSNHHQLYSSQYLCILITWSTLLDCVLWTHVDHYLVAYDRSQYDLLILQALQAGHIGDTFLMSENL
ncbi:hypothetical protein QVD17_03242 [Tagetes erecta]|uniref:Uncharacterized protein n=1 Tax=Tagetes erecta TaxID=13708 RepID=A0AAD8LDZ0_TARER|nr:hypothetical protein QVD17_03242 [Tagetes erecta]